MPPFLAMQGHGCACPLYRHRHAPNALSKVYTAPWLALVRLLWTETIHDTNLVPVL